MRAGANVGERKGCGMDSFEAGGKTICVFPAAGPDAPAVYLNTFGEEGRAVFDALTAAGGQPLTVVAISGLDWDRDMVPWDSPAVFKNAAPFTGGADDYLRLLTGEIVPAAERRLPAPPCWRGIAGYSLAGLFAVYALYHTEMFSRAASVSGSLWFPASGSTCSLTRPCAVRNASIFLWATVRAKRGTRCSGRYRRAPGRSVNFTGSRASAPHSG